MTTTRPPVHATDPITSHLAALHSEPSRKTHEALVLRAVTARPGRTISQYVTLIDDPDVYDRTEVARRMSDLKADGHVCRSGRSNPTGKRSESLWFPTAPLPVQIAMGL